LNLTLGLVPAVVTLGSFITILWGLSGARINIGSHALSTGIYGVACACYAVAGTWLTHVIGR
jgi:putative ATP-binding cassette transporter